MMQTIEGGVLSVPDMMSLTVRLAQILAAEVDLLEEMKVSEIEPLQKEKLLIVSALEAQKKVIQKYPDILADVDPQDIEEFKELMEVFNSVVEENHRRLLMAKEVNQKVVEAITEVVTESAIKGMYDKNGTPEGPANEHFSVTLDKKV